jgi:hypothetical protein
VREDREQTERSPILCLCHRFPVPQSFQPVDFDFLLKWLEFWVASDEFGLLFAGQRGGEGIGQTQLEARFEIGGTVGQGASGGMEIDRQASRTFAASAQAAAPSFFTI